MLTHETQQVFTNLVGTLAVILVIAAFIGGNERFSRVRNKGIAWQSNLVMGIMGGLLGVYGNLSGFSLNGAIISVRDIGPMIAGYASGPIGGFLAGAIAGIHRLTMGGITAEACVVATCSIGLVCGLLSQKHHKVFDKPANNMVIAMAMEIFHLCVVLIMVKPYSQAVEIVNQIAIPFVLVNAVGFTMMVAIITYIEKHREMVIEKTVMESELQVAVVIQHSLLPDLSGSYPGREEFDVKGFIEPAKTVGGDFYDVFFVDSNHVAFTIADVSGKGIPAALFMAASKMIVQNCVRDIPSFNEAVATANNVICNRNDAEMFITAWIGILEIDSGEMQFISAGHNPPVIVNKDGAKLLKVKSSFVLGGMENVKYTEHSVTLKKDDVLLLYTDGIVEAENSKKELYGEARMLECLKDAAGLETGEVMSKLKQSVEEFVNGHTQHDDMTMLCIKIKK